MEFERELFDDRIVLDVEFVQHSAVSAKFIIDGAAGPARALTEIGRYVRFNQKRF